MFAHRYFNGFRLFQSAAPRRGIAGARRFLASSRGGLSSLLALILLAALIVNVHAMNANDGYAPSASDVVEKVIVQPDGKALVAGSFTTIGGQACVALCRLNVDGSVDPSFVSPTVDSYILVMALQPDGKVLIGGQFTNVAGQPRHYLARLNGDGSLDVGFTDPKVSYNVYALALQPNGQLLVGGFFASVAGQPRHDLARLNSDGSLDASFADSVDTGSGEVVNALALQPDGKVLIGGGFASITGKQRHNLARLNADGTLDIGFPDLNVAFPGYVWALALQTDGKVLVGGEFKTIGGQPCNPLARVNPDGSVDAGFAYPNVQATSIDAIALQADGKVLVGGWTGDLSLNGGLLERLNTDGSVQNSIVNGPVASTGSYITSVAVQQDGKAIVGGRFTFLGGQPRSNLARLNASGATADTTLLNQAASNPVYTLAVQPDDTLLVGGSFTTIGMLTRHALARLKPDGNPDISFPDPQINAAVNAIAVQSDGRLLIGGAFTLVAGQPAAYIARLNATGGIDTSLSYSGADKSVYAIALQPDGKKFVIGGDFTKIQLQLRGHLARLNTADGSIDSGFADVKAKNTIDAVALQADGKVLIGGTFTVIANQPRHGLARLNADGTLDMSFPDLNISYPNQAITPAVIALALQPNGQLLVGGRFTSIGGHACHHLARINGDGGVDNGFFYPDTQAVYVDTFALQADGHVVIGGHTGNMFVNSGLLQRLNTDGSVESGTVVGPVGTVGGNVSGLALQADGKIVAGGSFNAVGGQTRGNLARLSTTSAALQSLATSKDGTIVSWLRAGASPELVAAPLLQLSGDDKSFVDIGFMTRVSGGWRSTQVPIPLDNVYYVRAHGHSAGGADEGSQGLIESTRQVFVH